MPSRRIYGAPALGPALLDRSALVPSPTGEIRHVLVRGAPRSGRTTLLTQWSRVDSSRLEGVWLDASTSWASPSSWWAHTLGLLADAGLVDRPEPRDPADAPARPEVIRTLLRLPATTTLVLDDLDRLPAPVRDDVVAVLRSVPRLHLVASVEDSWDQELDLPGTAVVEGLRFTVTDVAQLTSTPAEVAALVHEAIRGRPSGLGLVTITALPEVRTEPSPADDVELGRTATHVVRARGVEVVRRLRGLDRHAPSTDHLTVLRAWAAADPVTPELAAVLTPGVAVSEVVVRVAAAGLAERERTDGGARLRLLRPVRAVLEAGAPPLDRATHQRHARWALASGDLRRALVAASRAEDLALTSQILTAGGLPILWEHGALLVELFERTPLRRLQQHPVVALALGLALNARRQNRLRAAELFIAAAAAARLSRAVSPADRALMAVVESVALRLTGLGDGGVGTARRAARALRQLDAAGRDALGALHGDLHVHAGIGLLHGGAEEEAVREIEAGAAAAPPSTPNLHAWALLSGTAALRGDLDDARTWRDLALGRPWDPAKIDDYQGTFLRVAQSVIALEAGEVDEAERWLERVWPIVGTVEHWSVLLQVRGLIDIRRGRALAGLERAAQVRQARRSRTGTTEHVRRRLDENEALLHLAAGQTVAADRALRRQHRDDARGAVARARLALAQGRTDLALTRLARASALGLPTPRLRAEHVALEAATLMRLDRSELAERSTARLAALLDATGLSTPLLLVPGSEGIDLVHRLAPSQAGADARRADAVAPFIPNAPALTPREAVVLRHLAQTASVAEIAEALVVSSNTVKTQLRSVYRKLGVSTRGQALAAATGFGLLLDPVDEAGEQHEPRDGFSGPT